MVTGNSCGIKCQKEAPENLWEKLQEIIQSHNKNKLNEPCWTPCLLSFLLS